MARKQLKPIIIAGMEIELTYDNDRIEICGESYHDSYDTNFGSYFYAERDGSIHGRRFDGEVELISHPFIVGDHKRILKNFEQTFKEEVDDYNVKLRDIIEFNDTCGAHVHLSFYVDNPDKNDEKTVDFKDSQLTFNATSFSFRDVSSHKFLKRVKASVKRRVKEELPEVYPKFAKQYVRSYAKGTSYKDMYSREIDWNFSNSRNRNHCEFRAFNLNGVTTWEQFHKMYDILFSVITEELTKEINKKRVFEEKHKTKVVRDFKSVNEINITKELNVRDREVNKSYFRRL